MTSKKKPLEKDYWQTCQTTVADALRLTGCSHIALDACAKDAAAAKCDNFIDEQADALTANWNDYLWDTEGQPLIWCNPPYSMKQEFLARCAIMQAETGLPVAALVPVAVTTDWWYRLVVARATTIFIPNGRICFINAETGELETQPREATAIVVYGNYPKDVNETRKYIHYERTPEKL